MSKPSDDARDRKKHPARRDRLSAVRRGRWGETLACVALSLKGYRILARNYKTPLGEIDIVAKRGAVIAFVEVKARDRADDALFAVAPAQQGRIARAAQHFLATRPDLIACVARFDVALVTGPFKVRILDDAWRP